MLLTVEFLSYLSSALELYPLLFLAAIGERSAGPVQDEILPVATSGPRGHPSIPCPVPVKMASTDLPVTPGKARSLLFSISKEAVHDIVLCGMNWHDGISISCKTEHSVQECLLCTPYMQAFYLRYRVLGTLITFSVCPHLLYVFVGVWFRARPCPDVSGAIFARTAT